MSGVRCTPPTKHACAHLNHQGANTLPIEKAGTSIGSWGFIVGDMLHNRGWFDTRRQLRTVQSLRSIVLRPLSQSLGEESADSPALSGALAGRRGSAAGTQPRRSGDQNRGSLLQLQYGLKTIVQSSTTTNTHKQNKKKARVSCCFLQTKTIKHPRVSIGKWRAKDRDDVKWPVTVPVVNTQGSSSSSPGRG